MQLHRRSVLVCLLLSSVVTGTGAPANPSALAPFEGSSPVGAPPRTGSVEYDSMRRVFTVSGGGANMWFSNDSFHFVWTKVTGDVSLAADIGFLGAGGDPHRKACLLVRQSLDADSARQITWPLTLRAGRSL